MMRRRPRHRFGYQHGHRRLQCGPIAAGPGDQRQLAAFLAGHSTPVCLFFEQRLDVSHFPASGQRRGDFTDALAEITQDPRGFRTRAVVFVGPVAARATRALAVPDDRWVELVGGQVAARGTVDVGDGAGVGTSSRVRGTRRAHSSNNGHR